MIYFIFVLIRRITTIVLRRISELMFTKIESPSRAADRSGGFFFPKNIPSPPATFYDKVHFFRLVSFPAIMVSCILPSKLFLRRFDGCKTPPVPIDLQTFGDHETPFEYALGIDVLRTWVCSRKYNIPLHLPAHARFDGSRLICFVLKTATFRLRLGIQWRQTDADGRELMRCDERSK